MLFDKKKTQQIQLYIPSATNENVQRLDLLLTKLYY